MSQSFVRVLLYLGSPSEERLLPAFAVKPLCYDHEDFQRHLFRSVTPFCSAEILKSSAPIVVGTRGVWISCSMGIVRHFRWCINEHRFTTNSLMSSICLEWDINNRKKYHINVIVNRILISESYSFIETVYWKANGFVIWKNRSLKFESLSSCMGSFRPYLTGVVMQRSSIVFLTWTYPW